MKWRLVVCTALVLGIGCDQMMVGDGAISDSSQVSIAQPVGRESHGVFFPVGAGTFHSDLSCGDCHQSQETFKDFTCVSCHAHSQDVAAARHTFINDYQWKSESCRGCHPVGQEADISRPEHSLKYFGIASGSHAKLECSECHPFKTTAKTFKCLPCHEQNGPGAKAHAQTPKYRYDSFACYGCHPGR
jgi:Zn finger protein HypA/HybF involved in hydrogenase expression